MSKPIPISDVRTAAAKKREPMLRGSFDLFFPGGGSIRSKSHRPQTLREFIKTLTDLSAALEKCKSAAAAALSSAGEGDGALE